MATKAPKPPTPAEEAAQAEALNVFEQLQALGDAIQIAIFREPGRKFLELVGPDGLDEGMMRDRYGGGKFSLHTRDMSNRFVKGQPIRFTVIEGAPKMFPPAPAGTDPVAAVEIAHMRGELEAMKSAPDSRGNGGGDMLAIVTLLAPAVTAMLENVMSRPAPPDPIAMLDVYRKMVRDDRKEASANAPGESGMDPLLEKLGIPLLGEITKLRKQADGEKGADGDPKQIEAPKPTTLPELAAFMARWCAPHCARGTDPRLRAELFVEELTLQETELLASVVELSRVPDILDHWVKLVPEIGLNREWHGAFIEEIRALADDSDTGRGEDPRSPDPEGGRGDAGDDPGDDEPSESGGEK